jgi:hypothetical protein
MPATAHTILKKQVGRETNEAKVYKSLIGDSVQHVIPKFYREVELNNEGTRAEVDFDVQRVEFCSYARCVIVLQSMQRSCVDVVL